MERSRQTASRRQVVDRSHSKHPRLPRNVAILAVVDVWDAMRRSLSPIVKGALLVTLVLVGGGCSDEPDQKVDAPPECVAAWRGDSYAPVHCEEYPEAYKAIREGR